MEFRPYTTTENLYQESLHLRNKELRIPLGMQLSEEDTCDDPNRLHFAIVEQEHIVASVSLQPVDETKVKVRQMVVDRAYQGKGIGALLLSSAEKTLEGNTFSIIEMDARISAEPFYAKLGYQSEGGTYDLKGIPHVKMHKSIK